MDPVDLLAALPQPLQDNPSLSSIFKHQAADPDVSQRIFAVAPNDDSTSYVELTYADFSCLVEVQAVQLYDKLSPICNRGSGDHPVIGVLGNTGIELAAIILALFRLNAVLLLLSSANSEQALKHLLTSCKASVLFYDPAYGEACMSATSKCSIDAYPIEKFSWTQRRKIIEADIRLQSTLMPSPPAYPLILHSSGSTSLPKAVPWSQASLLVNSQIHYSNGGWSVFTQSNNRFLCVAPLIHSMGITLGLGAIICSGSTLVLPLVRSWPPSPADVVKSLSMTEINTCVFVPSLLEQLTTHLRDVGAPDVSGDGLKILTRLRILLVGGAHCPDHLANYLVSKGVKLRYTYGSTEAGHMMVGSHEELGDPGEWKFMRPIPPSSLIFKPLADESHSNARRKFEVHMDRRDPRLAPLVLSSTSEETWNTGDVVEEVEPGSGWYQLLFRGDDILVHDNGEKTNPIPMEEIARSCPLIDRMVVIGHRRALNAAIIQLDGKVAPGFSEEDREKILLEAMKEVNDSVPKHSKLLQEMILMLPLNSSKRIPVTNKGNFIRSKVEEVFKDEINELYQQISETPVTFGSQLRNLTCLTHAEVEHQVHMQLHGLLSKEEILPDDNLFDMGLDSLSVIALRKRLSQTLGIMLPQSFIFEHFTVSQITSAIVRRANTPSIDLSQPTETREKVLKNLLDRHLSILSSSAQLIQASRSIGSQNLPPTPVEGHVVAVTGATGSLGIWQVQKLLDRSDVGKVVCLSRGPTVRNVYDKLIKAFGAISMPHLVKEVERWRDMQLSQSEKPILELNQRLVVVPFDLSKPCFRPRDYLSLACNLTTIIHTAWKMDFNQVVESFEDCLSGTIQLLSLAGFIRHKTFYFVSSIGTVAHMDHKLPVTETFEQWDGVSTAPVARHGYSESKFIAENIVEAAASVLDIPCAIARVTQISGDSLFGLWKTQEMHPIIIAGSARIGKFPEFPFTMDWIPVDVVAAATVELALDVSKCSNTVIHHIANPHKFAYPDIFRHLESMALDRSSPKEWWDAITADSENPCHTLGGYIEALVYDPAEVGPLLDMTYTLQASKSLRECPPLDEHLWVTYVKRWRESGFLPRRA
ncbi:hypothetical protein GYMLUDRAFT_72098 [Collybiopsis luxurians FD-317 M1]|uniref:Carrier domain-containing protein n=1 Tax=Collybiopsis luxurians FD-317 M1 TaxID=944289 RepID=A0A0D0CKJ8_9AGAR|nr:hypothetical protein GYMLUDRAFT_72098 [Collybiopsis luxurians FD-317 M1]